MFMKLIKSNGEFMPEQKKINKRLGSIEDEIKVLKRETEWQIRETNKQIGSFHRERGTYTELILMPSIEKILTQKFKFKNFDTSLRRRMGDQEIEIDALAFDNEKNELLIVEVKTKLDNEDIKQLEKHIKRIGHFYPEHKNKIKFGMLASLKADSRTIKKVNDSGFYFASIENDLVKLNNTENFEVKSFT